MQIQTQTRGHTNPTSTAPKYLQQIWAKSISARVVHGDALCDIVVVTVCVCMCRGREWIQPGELVQGWSWDGGLLDGPRVSLKSGFQLNPWLSSKRTRKMTEVHDMARSPHPAKPFHFGPFVSLQLLIFMITPPDITPTSGLAPALATPPPQYAQKKERIKKRKKKLDRT